MGLRVYSIWKRRTNLEHKNDIIKAPGKNVGDKWKDDNWKVEIEPGFLPNTLYTCTPKKGPVWTTAISNNGRNLDEVRQTLRKVEVGCGMACSSSILPKQLEQCVLFDVDNVGGGGEEDGGIIPPHNLLSYCQALFLLSL